MRNRKRKKWKKWLFRSLSIFFFIGFVLLVNLIWFKPFKIEHFYDRAFIKFGLQSPELVSNMGIPILSNRAKGQLTDISDAASWKRFNLFKKEQKVLHSYDFDKQSPENQLNTKILDYYLQNQIDGEPFFYHDYSVSQLSGVQNELLSLMIDQHGVQSKEDAEKYISRLNKFKTKFDQQMEGLRIREDKGIIPPIFIIEKCLESMYEFLGIKDHSLSDQDTFDIEGNILYQDFETKVNAFKSLDESEKDDLLAAAVDAMKISVFPAYQSYINYFEKLKVKATMDAGVWKLPQGKEYYKYRLKSTTTTDMSPEEVHQFGLREVNRIKGEIWAIYKQLGVQDTTLSLEEGFNQAIQNRKDAYLYKKNEESFSTTILNVYSRIIDTLKIKIDKVFDLKPKADLEVKAAPQFMEALAAPYYVEPPKDGSRGGIFYANLHGMDEKDSILRVNMKNAASHEGIPGHHFQIALQTEMKDMPMFRNFPLFGAFMEGWASYAERLTYELGFYDDDIPGNLGRLSSEMFYAVGLVVDTGLHYKKWTRKEAVAYMVYNTFSRPEVNVESTIDRTIVWPGQACSYMVGRLKILELRNKANQELGDAFQLKEFHNVVLKNGSIPLVLLEEQVNQWIQERKSL